MASVAVVCSGPSVLETWPGDTRHDVVIAVNTAFNYIPDNQLDWWSAGDLLTMDAEARDAVCHRWPPQPRCGVLVNSGCVLPENMRHLTAFYLQDWWPITYRRRMFSGPCVAQWAAAALCPDRVTLYGVDLYGTSYADGVWIGDSGDARWCIESEAWRTVIDTHPGIMWHRAGGDTTRIRRTAAQFDPEMSPW